MLSLAQLFTENATNQYTLYEVSITASKGFQGRPLYAGDGFVIAITKDYE
jgi:hypothetical protein